MAGAGYIPFSKILEWGKFHGLSEDHMHVFVEYIRRLDFKYMEYQFKELEKK